MGKAVIVVVGFLGAFALPLVCSCSDNERAGGQKPGAQPNVLLVTFDTTRADHIGAYDCEYAFTPTVDVLARQSVKFKRAFAPTPATLPSHTSILTGLYPFYHGVRDNSHFVANPALNTLAEAFKQAGYQTAAMVAAFVLDSRFGLDQGFDTYDDRVRPAAEFRPFDIPERNAAAVVDAAIEWLASARRDAPFFLWVHCYDPHVVYMAPDLFTKYQGHPYDVEIAYADSELGRLLEYVESFTAGGRQTLTVFTADHGEALGQYGESTHAYFTYDSTLHVPLLIRLPDGSHAGREIDVPVGLVDLMPTIMDAAGLPVPDANHLHGRSLLQLIQSEKPPADFLDRPIAFESYEPHYSYGWAPLQGIRVGDTKFIDSPVPELYVLSENPKEIPSANRYTDRPELAAELQTAYRELFEGQLAFPPFTTQPQAPDQETIERLRALGYAAAPLPEESTKVTGKDLKEMLPFYRRVSQAMGMISDGENDSAAQLLLALLNDEPSDKHTLWMLAELAATVPSVAAQALVPLTEALESGRIPEGMVPQFLVNCGRAHLGKNDDERALKYFSDAQKCSPDYAAAFWWLGITCLRLDRPADAIQAMSRAAELFGPEVRRTRVVLGLAYFADGQTEEGARAWGKLLEEQQNSPQAIWRVAAGCLLDLGVAEHVTPALQRAAADASLPPAVRAVLGIACSDCFLLLRDNEQAMASLQGVRAFMPKDEPGLLLALAKLHLRLGQLAQARKLLEHARRRAPDRVDLVGTLAQVFLQAGDSQKAVSLLEDCYKDHLNDITAVNNLAWALSLPGQDLDRALQLAKRALRQQPGNAAVNDTLGWIYHQRGDREMAIRYLGRAARLDPDNAAYQYHLGVACRQAGQLERAREAFAQAVKLAPTPPPEWYERARQGSGG